MQDNFENRAAGISEVDIAERVAYLHGVLGLGFRRISKKLSSEGIKTSKDQAFRLYHKYKSCKAGEVEEGELKELKEKEVDARRKLDLVREKKEIRRRTASFIVEAAMESFERRKALFTDEKELFEFAKKTIPVIDPLLWDEFAQYCDEQGCDLAKAVAIALGEQKPFEQQLKSISREKQSIDFYLREQIRESLAAWKEDLEENSEPEDSERDTDIIIEFVQNEVEYIPPPSAEDSEYEIVLEFI